MKFNDWITSVMVCGNLCEKYSHKIEKAMSKKDLMDIVLDANGVSYLLEMQEIGFELPYETIIKEFGPYINGRYTGVHKNNKGHGYTSKIYCCYTDSDSIVIDTTATVLLGCTNKIKIKDNLIAKIYADNNCDIEIICPESSHVILECSKNALVSFSCCHENVQLTRRK